MTLELGLLGTLGRMGQVLIKASADDGAVRLVAASVPPGHRRAGSALMVGDGGSNQITLSDNAESVFRAAQAVVDFTHSDATRHHARLAAENHTPLVIGTTGLDAAAHKAIAEAAEKTAILHAPNMSLGINLMLSLAETAARALGADFNIEINDIHHAMKRDAPSGTALALGEAAAKGRGTTLEALRGTTGNGSEDSANQGEIGFSSQRHGDVVGDHSVSFCGPDERIELRHKAVDRRLFARGALQACKWLKGKPAGLYSMKDVLGL
jgi:4-hydroxy-tetrahydrodipicolinate reductase